MALRVWGQSLQTWPFLGWSTTSCHPAFLREPFLAGSRRLSPCGGGRGPTHLPHPSRGVQCSAARVGRPERPQQRHRLLEDEMTLYYASAPSHRPHRFRRRGGSEQGAGGILAVGRGSGGISGSPPQLEGSLVSLFSGGQVQSRNPPIPKRPSGIPSLHGSRPAWWGQGQAWGGHHQHPTPSAPVLGITRPGFVHPSALGIPGLV